MIVAYPLDFRLEAAIGPEPTNRPKRVAQAMAKVAIVGALLRTLQLGRAEAQLHSTSFRIILRDRPNT